MGEVDRMSALPDALGKSRRTVLLEGPRREVVVEKWSISKFCQVVELIEEVVHGLPDDKLAAMKGGSIRALGKMAEALGPRLTAFLRISVRPEDREVISDELAAEDALALLEAVVDLNFTERLRKKAKALWSKIPTVQPTNGAKDPSQS